MTFAAFRTANSDVFVSSRLRALASWRLCVEESEERNMTYVNNLVQKYFWIKFVRIDAYLFPKRELKSHVNLNLNVISDGDLDKNIKNT